VLETTDLFEGRRDFFLPLDVRLIRRGKAAAEGDGLLVSCKRGDRIAKGERHVAEAFET
jgi:hypothetical protein